MHRQCSGGAIVSLAISRAWTSSRPQRKPRGGARGGLARLRGEAREKLHAWFREAEGTITQKEIAQRLKQQFDIRASSSSLSDYYHKHYAEIVAPDAAGYEGAPHTTTIRISIPAGCRVDVSTDGALDEGGEQTS